MLFTPQRGLCQHESRDVGASDEEGHGDRREKQPEHKPHGTEQILQQWRDLDGRSKSRRALPQSAEDSIQVFVRGQMRHAIAQSSDDEQHADVRQNVRTQLSRGSDEDRDHRRPELGAARKIERTWHDPDDGVQLSIQGHRVPHDVRIRPKPSGPCAIVQHDHTGRIRHVIVRAEGAAKHRPGLKHLEERRRNGRKRQPDRLVAPVHDHGPDRRSHCSHTGKAAASGLYIAKVLVRELDDFGTTGKIPPPADDETVRSAKWQRPKQNGVDRAKDPACGSDRERKDEDDRRCVAGVFEEMTNRHPKMSHYFHGHRSLSAPEVMFR